MAGQYRFKDQSGNIVAQISASADGVISFSGSQVNFASANSINLGNVQLSGTASNANLLDGYDSTSFVFTSSFNTISSSTSARLNSIETISASNISRINSLETTSASVNTLNDIQNARLSALETTSASVDNLNSAQNTRLTNLENKTGSLATTGSNTFIGTQVFTGSVYITSNLIVQGSSSIQNITGSAVSIGTNTVILNTANPAVRYAGISVIDSGSTGLTGSILWDSTNNNWLYQNPSGSSYTSAKFIAGPQSSALGSEPGLVTNYLMKAVGDDHISSSAIFDNGSTISLKSNTEVSGTFKTTGNVTFGGTGLFSSDVFTYNNGGIFFSGGGSYTTGIFQNASGLQLQTGGAPKLSIASDGSTIISSTSTDYGLSITNIQDSSQGLLVRASDNDTSLYILNLQSSVGATSQSWVSRFVVTKAGSVGIGTTSPSSNSRLHVYRGGGSYDTIVADGDAGTNTGFGIYEAGVAKYAIYSSGASGNDSFNIYNFGASADSLTILSNGYIGIGNSPSTKFHIEGSATTGTIGTEAILTLGRALTSGVSFQNAASFNLGRYNTTGGSYESYTRMDIALKGNSVGNNYTTDINVISMLNSGNIGIGTTSPQTRLDVYRLETNTRTSYTDILTINADASTSPYSGHGGGILFRGGTYSGTSNNTQGNRMWGRIGMYLNDAYDNFSGENMFFAVAADDRSDTLTTAMTIKYNRNIGIGTPNPLAPLHVISGGNSATIIQTGSQSWIMFSKIIQSYGGTTNNPLLTISGQNNTGVMIKVVIRGTNAVGNIQYEDVGYASWYSIGGSYQNSNIIQPYTIVNVAGTHGTGTLNWGTVSTTPTLRYSQANNGYILESFDIYVTARDSATITFNTDYVSAG